jgi:hypothetical protein
MSDGYISSVSSLANITYLCTRHQRSKDIPKGLHRITDKVNEERLSFRFCFYSPSSRCRFALALLHASEDRRSVIKGNQGGQTFKGSFGSIVPSQGGIFPTQPRRITQPPRFPITPVRSLVCYCVAVSQAKRPKGPPATSTYTHTHGPPHPSSILRNSQPEYTQLYSIIRSRHPYLLEDGHFNTDCPACTGL